MRGFVGVVFGGENGKCGRDAPRVNRLFSTIFVRTRQSLGQGPFAGGIVMTIVTMIKRNYCFRSPDDGVGSWFLQWALPGFGED